MNIHEHQAKQILKQFGVVVPEGVFGQIHLLAPLHQIALKFV